MRLRFKHTNYPMSQKLTNKSRRVGTLTHPLYGIMLGIIPGLLAAILLPSSVTLPMILMVVGMVAAPILLAMYRKKKFAQFDAEYEKILQSMQK